MFLTLMVVDDVDAKRGGNDNRDDYHRFANISYLPIRHRFLTSQ
jgi:hypothetical protein